MQQTLIQWSKRFLNRFSLSGLGLIIALFGLLSLDYWGQAALAQDPEETSGQIAGKVYNEWGPAENVRMRIQTTDRRTHTAEDGSFLFEAVDRSEALTITAWSKGFYFGWVSLPATTDLEAQAVVSITLRPHHRGDNFEYIWQESADCGECHTAYVEWQADAHSLTAVNPYFISMYRGTDIHGNQSPPSGHSDGFETLPVFDETYFGPGFKLDFPHQAGNCASCHVPQAASLATTDDCSWAGCHSELTAARSDEIAGGVDPIGLSGVAAEGISCDFCHKIGKVFLDEETGLPDPVKTGIMSLSVYRPPEDEDLFFGSVDDVARKDDSFLPLQSESAFCAACHYGEFHETVIYNSFGEWLASPYSDPETGQSCQDCHMPEVDHGHFVFPEKGGLARDANQVHNHQMPGSRDVDLLKNSVSMTTTVLAEADMLYVDVEIKNDKAGHHVPTGSPLRHVILVLEATDAQGQALSLAEGEILPDWAGNYAGQVGRGFAKILRDQSTGYIPSVSFWKPTEIVADTRIPAMTSDHSHYRFKLSGDSQFISLRTKLVYRRAFQEVMDWKDWSEPDIIMEKNLVVIGHLCTQTPCIL